MISISLSGDLVTWTNSFSNGTPIKEVIEEPNLSIRENLKLGVQSTNSLKLTVSGLVAYCHEFVSESKKFIRFAHDGDVTFVGKLQTYNTKFDDGEVATLSLTYKDFIDVWKDATFCPNPREAKISYKDPNVKDVGTYSNKEEYLKNLEKVRNDLYKEFTEGTWKGNSTVYEMYVDTLNKIDDVKGGDGSGVYEWEFSALKRDGYRAIDMADTSHSLLHKLLSYLPVSEYRYFSIISTVTRTTPVIAFKCSGDDKILDVVNGFCEQNSIAISMHGFEIHVHDLYEQKGQATTVRRIEAEATLTDKPYIDKTFPDIRWCSKVDNVEYSQKGINTPLFHAESTHELGAYKIYPDDGSYLELEFKPRMPSNVEVFNVRISEWHTGASSRGLSSIFDPFGNIFPKVWMHKEFGTRAFAQVKNPVYYITFKKWSVFCYGTVTYVEYADVLKSLHSNGDETTCKYIYNIDDARKYDLVRKWQKDADSKYYTFYADDNLNLGDLITLSGIEDKALIVTSKTDRLDPFGGYTYTASEVIDSSQVSFDENHQAVNLELPTPSNGFTLTATKSLIPCGFDGQPSDSTPIRITCVVDSLLSTPTCEVDGKPIQLTEEFDRIGDDALTTGRWHIDIDPYLSGYAQQTYEFTVGGKTESVTLRKVATSNTEAQYAIGTDPENPPVQEAKWNGEVCTWNGEVATWDEGLWDENPTQPARGEYLWMRTRSRA